MIASKLQYKQKNSQIFMGPFVNCEGEILHLKQYAVYDTCQ